MHHPTRQDNTYAFVTPVVEHWLERHREQRRRALIELIP